MRKNIINQLRDAMQIKCKRLNKSLNVQSLSKRQNNDVRNIIHHNIALFRLKFDRKKELQIVIKFD